MYLRELSSHRRIRGVVLDDEAENVHDGVGELLSVIR